MRARHLQVEGSFLYGVVGRSSVLRISSPARFGVPVNIATKLQLSCVDALGNDKGDLKFDVRSDTSCRLWMLGVRFAKAHICKLQVRWGQGQDEAKSLKEGKEVDERIDLIVESGANLRC